MTAPAQHNGKPIPSGRWLARVADVVGEKAESVTAPMADLCARLAEAADYVFSHPEEAEAVMHEAATSLAAVTAERDQAVRELAEQKRVNTSSLHTMTEQLDQARQMLADAPHDSFCAASHHFPNLRCSCWKAGL